MKSILFAALVCVIVNGAFAQGGEKQSRKVGSFRGISVAHGIDLYLTQGDESVSLSANESKYLDMVVTEVKDGMLMIYIDGDKAKRLKGSKDLRAYVSCKTLEKLHGSSGSDIHVSGTVKAGRLVMHISGGSDFDGRIEASDLDIEASGGSDVNISGSVKKLKINSSGGSDFSGYGLTADECELEASGGSDVEITVNKELKADASDSSDVTYKGAAVVKDVRTSGGSSLRKF